MTGRMTLGELLGGVVDAGRLGEMQIRGLTLDSRRLRPGEAFVALRGGQHHGMEFAAAARKSGACVVLAEAPALPAGHDRGPTIWIEGLRERLGEVAARFFGYPGEGLCLTGVTGTNGKTSVVQLLAQAWNALGHCAASIGTLGAGLHGAVDAGERTTPDAITVQATLADLRDQGAQQVAMEVSSHALDQGRVNAVPYRVAVFTNLSRDHLDYHGSMDAYFEAKAKLFACPTLQTAVVNVDDEHGRQLAQRMSGRVKLLRVALHDKTADITAADLQAHADGFDFTLTSPWGTQRLHSQLLGQFNVVNLLLAAACLGASGVPFDRLCKMIPQLQPIRGRMNRIGGDGHPLVVIDYAHTPQALQMALQSLRPHTRGRLMCVFGAGGDRDAGKRPEMGAIAESLADAIIITDDNPRSEDGDVIVEAIRAGLTEPARAMVERDRARAIGMAIGMAAADDVVLVAGKGHETTQEDRHGKHPFDDRATAMAALEAKA